MLETNFNIDSMNFRGKEDWMNLFLKEIEPFHLSYQRKRKMGRAVPDMIVFDKHPDKGIIIHFARERFTYTERIAEDQWDKSARKQKYMLLGMPLYWVGGLDSLNRAVQAAAALLTP